HMARIRRHPAARSDPAGAHRADRERPVQAVYGPQAREVRDARRLRRSVRLDEQGRSAAYDPVVRRLGLLVAALALVLAGCGGTTGPGSGGADFVPASAPLYLAINTDLGSSQWDTVNELANKFPDKQKAIDSIKQQLTKNGLDWDEDVKPALGPELDLVMLDFNHPDDI